MDKLTEALQVLWTTSDPSERARADAWLRSFQDSSEAWQLSLQLVQSAESGDARLFGVTILCNKLRGGAGGGLPSADIRGLRGALLSVLRAGAQGRLHHQLCRAISLLLGDVGIQDLLSDPQFAELPMPTVLELLGLIPLAGGWLKDAEVEQMQLLLLTLLDHACDPLAVPFPSAQLPVRDVPSESSTAYRTAVLSAACHWVALPAAEGLTLSVLTEAPCFAHMLRRMQSFFQGGAPDAPPAEVKLVFELCIAALDLEPTEEVFLDGDTSTGGRRTLLGSTLPYLPPEVLLALLNAVGSATQPLASTARCTSGEEESADDFGELDEAEAGARLSVIVLGGTLVRKASALLAGSAPQQLLTEPQKACSQALAALLQLMVPCAAHRHRPLCEAVDSCDFWPSALRAVEHWDASAREALLQQLAEALSTRAAFPPDAALAEWGAAELDEYLSFRDSHLKETFAQIARHVPGLLAHMAVGVAGGAAGAVSWQRREAALFAACSTAEVLTSRVLPTPGMPPTPEAAALEGYFPSLLRAALVPPASVAVGMPAAEALLLRTRCQLVHAFAPWLAGPGKAVLDEAIAGVLPCVDHAAATTAEEGLITLLQLSMRCAPEIAESRERLQAVLALLGSPTPALDADARSKIVACSARLVVAASEELRIPLVEQLFSPLLAAVDSQIGALEAAHAAAAGGVLADMSGPAAALVVSLNNLSAAVGPLTRLGRPAVSAVAIRIWPSWARAGAICHVAPSALLPPLCALGRAVILCCRTDFVPLLQTTVQVLTSALASSPREGTPLLELAATIVEVFCDQPGFESAFSSLLDQIASHVLPVLSGCGVVENAELATVLLTLVDLYCKFIVPALLASSSFPSLLGLSTNVLSTCRAPEPVLAAAELLAGAAMKARRIGVTSTAAGSAKGNPEAVEALQQHMMHALSGPAGDALLRSLVSGLADTLPPAAVPRAADILCPLLHTHGWKPTLRAWAMAALTAVPMVDGVPDAATKEMVLNELCNLPDAVTANGIALDVVSRLRNVLNEFARVCRRMDSAQPFEVAAYHWKSM